MTTRLQICPANAKTLLRTGPLRKGEIHYNISLPSAATRSSFLGFSSTAVPFIPAYLLPRRAEIILIIVDGNKRYSWESSTNC